MQHPPRQVFGAGRPCMVASQRPPAPVWRGGRCSFCTPRAGSCRPLPSLHSHRPSPAPRLAKSKINCPAKGYPLRQTFINRQSCKAIAGWKPFPARASPLSRMAMYGSRHIADIAVTGNALTDKKSNIEMRDREGTPSLALPPFSLVGFAGCPAPPRRPVCTTPPTEKTIPPTVAPVCRIEGQPFPGGVQDNRLQAGRGNK